MVTHQLQVWCRPGKVHRSETNVLPLSYTTSSLHDVQLVNKCVVLIQEMLKQLKSAPRSSLTSRLAACMCIVNHSYGGLRAVAQLWQEFVLEMRYRWDHGFTVTE